MKERKSDNWVSDDQCQHRENPKTCPQCKKEKALIDESMRKARLMPEPRQQDATRESMEISPFVLDKKIDMIDPAMLANFTADLAANQRPGTAALEALRGALANARPSRPAPKTIDPRMLAERPGLAALMRRRKEPESGPIVPSSESFKAAVASLSPADRIDIARIIDNLVKRTESRGQRRAS